MMFATCSPLESYQKGRESPTGECHQAKCYKYWNYLKNVNIIHLINLD